MYNDREGCGILQKTLKQKKNDETRSSSLKRSARETSCRTHCDGKIIVLLPFRHTKPKTEYLLRKEVTPCWSMKQAISYITGGYEKSKGIKGTAVMELEEEAGYEVKEKDLIPLGTCRGTKSCDTVYHLFAVDLTDKEKTTDAKGDGSELEAKAECVWRTNLDECEDPMAYVAYTRLKEMA